MNQPTYTTGFFEQNVKSSTPSALKALGRLFEIYQPESVVDFGCGSGAWLAGAEAHGATTLRGFDGPWVDPRALTSPNIEFTAQDFEKDLPDPDRTYDLGISVEVAEHLEEETAKRFIARLAQASEVIVFSAAAPYQGGTHHINEHPQSYWIQLFEAAGFESFDFFRAALWEDEDVKWWFKQNLFLFVHRDSQRIDRERARSMSKPLVDVIHPENFVRKIKLNQGKIRDLEKSLKAEQAVPAAPACDCSEQLTAIRAELVRLGDLRQEVQDLRAALGTSSGAQTVRELERVARGAARRVKKAARR